MSIVRNYKPVKESRGWYFVEYYPANESLKIAVLNLIVMVEPANKNDIVNAMEKELKDWVEKYPVPLFVYAYDSKEDRFQFDELNKPNPLAGFINLEKELVKDEQIPDVNLDQSYLDRLYSNIEFVTDFEYDAEGKRRRKQIETGLVLFLLLPFVISVIYETFIYFNNFFSLLAFLYVLYKAVQRALKFVGMWPKSKREKDKELEDRMKDHYYYHCQMNPEGFKELMLENNVNQIKDDIAKEAKALQKSKSPEN